MKKYLNKVIHGDCLEVMKELPKDILIISDPPYNQGYHYNEYKDSMSEKQYEEFMKSVFRPPCVIIHYPEDIIGTFSKFLGRPDEVVSWVYNSNTAKQHRLICWWGCKPDFSKIKQPYKNPKDKRIIERIKNGNSGASLYDWWEINQVKNIGEEKTNHPCQIPEEIIKRIVELTTDKGDVVIDPFLGSGTTARACKDLGRNFIGIEISKEYCEIAEKRLAQETLFNS